MVHVYTLTKILLGIFIYLKPDKIYELAIL